MSRRNGSDKHLRPFRILFLCTSQMFPCQLICINKSLLLPWSSFIQADTNQTGASTKRNRLLKINTVTADLVKIQSSWSPCRSFTSVSEWCKRCRARQETQNNSYLFKILNSVKYTSHSFQIIMENMKVFSLTAALVRMWPCISEQTYVCTSPRGKCCI